MRKKLIILSYRLMLLIGFVAIATGNMILFMAIFMTPEFDLFVKFAFGLVFAMLVLLEVFMFSMQKKNPFDVPRYLYE